MTKRNEVDDSTSWDQFRLETYHIMDSSWYEDEGRRASAAEDRSRRRSRTISASADDRSGRSSRTGRRSSASATDDRSGRSSRTSISADNSSRRNRSVSLTANEPLVNTISPKGTSKRRSWHASWKCPSPKRDSNSTETMRDKLLRQKREGARLGRISKGKFVAATSLAF